MSLDEQLAQIKADKERLNALCDRAIAKIVEIEAELDGVGVHAEIATSQGLFAYSRVGKKGEFHFTLKGVRIHSCKRMDRLLVLDYLPDLVTAIQYKFKELLASVKVPQQHDGDDQEPRPERAPTDVGPKRNTYW